VRRLLARRGGRYHDLLRRRRCPGPLPDRREMHRAGVEQQGHRGRAEEHPDQRRRHPPSGYPESPSFTAFVGRHRPVLPFRGSFPDLASRDTRNPIGRQPVQGADIRCFRRIINDTSSTCGGWRRRSTLGA
jgi:hypothetical protein